MFRNNSYDGLPNTISRLKEKLKNSEIKKAQVCDIGSMDSYISTFPEIDELCKSTHSQFKALQKDYRTGKINLVRYKDHLGKLKDLLTSVDAKITNPNLHADEIATEVSKYI